MSSFISCSISIVFQIRNYLGFLNSDKSSLFRKSCKNTRMLSFNFEKNKGTIFPTECNEIISTLPYTDISASSYKLWKKRKSCTPEMGDIESAKGWCPRRQSSECDTISFLFINESIHPEPFKALYRKQLPIFFMLALLRRASFWSPSMVYISVIITHIHKNYISSWYRPLWASFVLSIKTCLSETYIWSACFSMVVQILSWIHPKRLFFSFKKPFLTGIWTQGCKCRLYHLNYPK